MKKVQIKKNIFLAQELANTYHMVKYIDFQKAFFFFFFQSCRPLLRIGPEYRCTANICWAGTEMRPWKRKQKVSRAWRKKVFVLHKYPFTLGKKGDPPSG